MERIMSIAMGGGISYVVLSLEAMLLTAFDVSYRFSPLAVVAIFPALICGLWWYVHRADHCYCFQGLSGLMTNVATIVSVIGGLMLAAHVTATIY